jgi:hypothetical protein
LGGVIKFYPVENFQGGVQAEGTAGVKRSVKVLEKVRSSGMI